jgi:hypothetical protein
MPTSACRTGSFPHQPCCGRHCLPHPYSGAFSLSAYRSCLPTTFCPIVLCRLTPNEPCPPAKLKEVGVLCWTMDPSAYPDDPKLQAIMAVRGYNYQARQKNDGWVICDAAMQLWACCVLCGGVVRLS